MKGGADGLLWIREYPDPLQDEVVWVGSGAMRRLPERAIGPGGHGSARQSRTCSPRGLVTSPCGSLRNRDVVVGLDESSRWMAPLERSS